jgi:transcriptional regulator with XRE-family HTH domain
MTVPLLTPRQEGKARLIAREIGAAFRAERLARGDRLRDVAKYLGSSERSIGNISDFERGKSCRVMLPTMVRMLDVYGLTLVVVYRHPRGRAAHADAHHAAHAHGNALVCEPMRKS